jgi:hypothetical protein
LKLKCRKWLRYNGVEKKIVDVGGRFAIINHFCGGNTEEKELSSYNSPSKPRRIHPAFIFILKPSMAQKYASS